MRHYDSSDDALAFANSKWAEELCGLGTSCPDHFLRTRISPLYVPWKPADGLAALKEKIAERLITYREDYAKYYKAHADKASPALRDSNPSVVVVPGLGLFGFGKDKREARITSEFFVNAIHVMAGANALEDTGAKPGPAPQARRAEQAGEFKSYRNYVALPRSEAFRIEYWALEEAKLQRMPPEREFSRRIAVIVGGASGIGREVALLLAKRGAHVVVADLNAANAEAVAKEAAAHSSPELVMGVALDLTSRDSIAAAFRATIMRFGGIDSVINTAAIFPTPAPGTPPEQTWGLTMSINVTSNHVLADEAAKVLKEQGLPGSIVLTSSANAVVPKAGSEAYDVSKAAINHLIRELAIGLGPARPRQRRRPRDGRGGLGDVPARPRHGLAEEVRHRVHRGREHRVAAQQARRVLRAAHDHPPADPAGGLRQCDRLPGGGAECEDDGACHSGRWRAA